MTACSQQLVIYITVACLGPGMTAVYATEDCVTYVREQPTGMIQPPDYPQPYSPNSCFRWFIKGDSGTSLTLSFQDLNIPDDPQTCLDSYLQIGPDPYQQICGNLNNSKPLVYISHHALVWLNFRGSGKTLGRGFSLQYIQGTNRSVTCPSGQYHCANGKCIPDMWMCNAANECGDNSDENGCKAIVQRTTPSPTDCGPLRFSCLDMQTGKFTCHMIYKRCDQTRDCHDGSDEQQCGSHRNCGGLYEGDKGIIKYPNSADHPILSKMNCVYHIRVEPGKKIRLRFQTFQLAHSLSQPKLMESLLIYDGGSENADILAVFDHNELPPPNIESRSNELFLIVDRENLESYHGQFAATYQGTDAQPCGPQNGTHLCNSGHCIHKAWLCDGTDDCPDASDEMYCPGTSVKVVTAAVIGTLSCALLLVVALGCLCRLYTLRMHQNSLSLLRYYQDLLPTREQLIARQMAPPPYLEAMVTSRPFDEVQRELRQLVQLAGAAQGPGDSGGLLPQSSRSTVETCDVELFCDMDLAENAADEVLLDLSVNGCPGHVDITSSRENLAMQSSHVSFSHGGSVAEQWHPQHKDSGDELIPTVDNASMDTASTDQQQDSHVPIQKENSQSPTDTHESTTDGDQGETTTVAEVQVSESSVSDECDEIEVSDTTEETVALLPS